MRLPVVGPLESRDGLTTKGRLLKNAFAEAKGDVVRVIKRPGLFSEMTVTAGAGQGLFVFQSPSGAAAGAETVVAITGDTLDDSPTKLKKKLSFSVQPIDWKVQTAMTPAIVVHALTSFGDLNTSFDGNVTLSFASNPDGAVLSGTLTVAAVAGVATFSNVKIDDVGGNYTLKATGSGIKAGTSSKFKIFNNVDVSLISDAVPPSTAFHIRTWIRNSDASVHTAYVGNVTVELLKNWTPIAETAYSTTLGGTLTLAASSGICNFTDLTITLDPDDDGTDYRIRATASTGELIEAVSASFDVTWALAFTTQPANTAEDTTMSNVVVTMRDAAGNTVTGFTGDVTIAIGTNPGSGVLSGTLTRTAVAGVATFNDLSINDVGSGYTLSADCAAAHPPVDAAVSNAFNITAGHQYTVTVAASGNVLGYEVGTLGAISPTTYGGFLLSSVSQSEDTPTPGPTCTFLIGLNSVDPPPYTSVKITDYNGLETTLYVVDASVSGANCEWYLATRPFIGVGTYYLDFTPAP